MSPTIQITYAQTEDSGKTRSRKNLSPHLGNRCTTASTWRHYFGTLESTEGSQLPGEDLNSILWLILAQLSSSCPSSTPVTWQAAIHLFLVQLAQSLQEPRWAKDPVLQILGTFSLIAGCCFWPRRSVRRALTVLGPPCFWFKLLALWLKRLQPHLPSTIAWETPTENPQIPSVDSRYSQNPKREINLCFH